jgi:hypothetical protein
MSDEDEPTCIHDGGRYSVPWPVDRENMVLSRETNVWCELCDSLLYTERVFWDHTFQVIPKDKVWERFYTQEGRQKLLIKLMRDAGMRIPEMWIS